MTALSFVWVHPHSKNSRCDIILHGFSSLSDVFLLTLIGTHYLAKNWCHSLINFWV